MATVNANGDLQLEQGDIIPREIAVKDDDSAEVRKLIAELNVHKFSPTVFAKVLEIVDSLRAADKGVDNPDLLPENQ